MNVVILPVPYEKTTSFLRGCARGPEALLDALSAVESSGAPIVRRVLSRFDLTVDPRIPVDFADFEEMRGAVAERIEEHVRAGSLPVAVGGEHSLTFACFDALHRALGRGRLDIVQCDAHSDLRDEYEGDPWSHACVMRRIASLKAGGMLQCGIRSQCVEEARFMRDHGMEPLGPDRINATTHWDDAALAGLPGPVYLTIDMDFFDPTAVPGVGTPEPGGVGARSGVTFVRFVASSRRIAAFDIVELMPLPGRPQSDMLAARLIFEILDAQAGFLDSTAPA